MKTEIPKTDCGHCEGTGEVIDHVAVGAMLRKMRTDAGVSLRQLAEAVKLKHSYIADLEAGRRGADKWTETEIEKWIAAIAALKKGEVEK